jgi:hypothetical protein
MFSGITYKVGVENRTLLVVLLEILFFSFKDIGNAYSFMSVYKTRYQQRLAIAQDSGVSLQLVIYIVNFFIVNT